MNFKDALELIFFMFASAGSCLAFEFRGWASLAPTFKRILEGLGYRNGNWFSG